MVKKALKTRKLKKKGGSVWKSRGEKEKTLLHQEEEEWFFSEKNGWGGDIVGSLI